MTELDAMVGPGVQEDGARRIRSCVRTASECVAKEPLGLKP
ncbi:hypothetical protein ABT255_45945 [Streptomyces mirabilis]